MSYFVIIRGPLGVGKSTIAKKLSKFLNAEYVDIDKILRKNNLDKVKPGAECIPAKNFIKADDLVLPGLKNKIHKGKIVIFDACFYHKKHIEDIVRKLPFRHFIFTLKAPVEVCIERDSKRKKIHGKLAAIAVHHLVTKFNYGIVTDTNNKTPDETLQEIKKHLPDKALSNKLNILHIIFIK